MKRLNNKAFALLETIVVSVFVVSIFTFVYISIVPLIGRYDELLRDNDIESTFLLYNVRDAIYKDKNFDTIVDHNYKKIENSDFDDKNYYSSLTSELFDDNNYDIIYIKKIKQRVDAAINTLNIKDSFKEYIKKIAKKYEDDDNFDNFLFLNNNGNFSYLGLGTDANDLTNYKDKGVIDFNNHIDTSGANAPKLLDGMIPIYFADGAWYKADRTNKSNVYYWYDYNLFKWANVALVKESKRSEYIDNPVGTQVNESDVIAYYVWIPRFEYYISDTYAGGTLEYPGEIKVNFVKNNISKKRTVSGNIYRTATAFTFEETELDGFWFAKFETSSSERSGFTINGSFVPYILPDKVSMKNEIISSFYTKVKNYMNGENGETIYGLSSSTYTHDSHVMKNDEWGAVAYLSQSKYGKMGNILYDSTSKGIYINNRIIENSVMTGSSAGMPGYKKPSNSTINCSVSTNSSLCYKYTVEGLGTGASSTGSVYGVFDLAGGNTEMVMGAISSPDFRCNTRIIVQAKREQLYSGFNGILGEDGSCITNMVETPELKYINLYGSTRKYYLRNACDKNGINNDEDDTCYSHAMSETAGWYGNYYPTYMILRQDRPWIIRGGACGNGNEYAGVFSINSYDDDFYDGKFANNYTSRPTIFVY